MFTVNAAGAKLTPTLFIDLYHRAKKLAPPRFLTLRIHPDRYKELYALAEIPESIQIGPTPGPLGRQIVRVACIKPPLGVADGIAIQLDDKADPSKMVFEIHGIAEMIVDNLLT
ncbi:hypothetical protein KGP36_03300 [Patescibacteria group bacterium]|nr:hypothetical protein [Patescibacteria group bacterium]